MEKEELVRQVIKRVFEKLDDPTIGSKTVEDKSKIIAGVSVRHAHLSRADIDKLFGKGYELKPLKYLSQPGQYGAEEVVTLVGKKLNAFENVRVLGPPRPDTQVELSKTDAIYLGVDAPTRVSGDIAGSANLTLIGPAGSVDLKEGVIRAERHIHMSPQSAEYFGLKDRDVVDVRVSGPRGLTFNNVVVRVSTEYKTEFHVDTDDANTCDLVNGSLVEIVDASCVNPVSEIQAPIADSELIPPFIPDDSTYKVLNSLPSTTLEPDKPSGFVNNQGPGEILTLEELKKILDKNGQIDIEKYNLTPLAQDYLDTIRSE
jgi:putative phosphotransacetylase